VRKPDVDFAALRALVARVYGRRPVGIARTESGTTTQVYRLTTDETVHYLRVAEDQPDRYGVELVVHERLLARGARVPAIVHYEPFDLALDRSVLITTEIPGRPASENDDAGVLPSMLRAAGRDLALINSIPVSGFGFMERSDPFPTSLSAEFPDAMAFIEHDLVADLAVLKSELPASVADGIRDAVQTWQSPLGSLPGYLAHGDFDWTHIYATEAGYSGIIDFGEIRGAGRLYDLGHFAVIAEGAVPGSALDHLIGGYGEIMPLSAADRRRMWLWAALIGFRFLARTSGRSSSALRAQIAGRIARALREQAG
jgi:aminoglycoside phosphotransferase (APT) family kinase protein